MKKYAVRLPYVDNVKAVLLTIAINLIVIFVFFWPNGVTFGDVLVDSVICAVITTIINMVIAYTKLKKMRAEGQMPSQVPVSSLMQKLPQNPIALGVIYAIVFAVLMVAINGLLLWFFDMDHMAFAPWLVYKLIYTTLLSMYIMEFCIFRFVQPDWAVASETKAAMAEENTQTAKNPLLKISIFKELYGSVTGNIAMNFIMGTLLGGAVVGASHEVIIYPTTVQGIPITGLFFGLLTGLLVTGGILKAMKETILTYGEPMAQAAPMDKRFIWMPKSTVGLKVLVCISLMIFSAVVLWAIMTFFELSIMNFYQFTVFITIYAFIVSKPLSYVLVQRLSQKDYIVFVLRKEEQKAPI